MDYFEQIEAYKLNTLTEAERAAFESAMAADEALAQAVEDYDVAMDVVGSILEGEIRDLINNETERSRSVEYDNARSEGTAKAGVQEDGVVESGKLKIDGSAPLTIPDGDLKDDGSAPLTIQDGGVGDGEDLKDRKGGKVRRMNWMRWASAAVVIGVVGWWGMKEYQFKQLEEDIFANYYVKPNEGVNRGELDLNSGLQDSVLYFFNKNYFKESIEIINNSFTECADNFCIKYKTENLFNQEKYDEVIALLTTQEFLSTDLIEILCYSYILNNQNSKAKTLLSSMDKEQVDKVSNLFN